MSRRTTLGILACLALLLIAGMAAVQAVPAVKYLDTFETDLGGWQGGIRVASGTHGVTSASGAWHAEMGADYTKFGGYSSTFPPLGYTTEVAIYLNVNGGWANDTRFDWTVASNKSDETHLRDFDFSVGFYNDQSLGNRFVMSCSNGAGRGSAYPKNPGRDPYTVSSTGWYIFRHHFYNDGGALRCDLSLCNSGGSALHTWSLSDPSDLIASVVGGHRYGWFASQEFAYLAIDNVRLAEEMDTPSVVWVDDDWTGSAPGANVGGHVFGYDAFAVIQQGVDAVALAGTVNVLAGNYTEGVNATKAVTLTGAGIGQTILNGGFLVNVNGVTIDGFTARGGYQVWGSWAGVETGTVQDLTVRNCELDGQDAGYFGFELSYNTRNVSVENCDIHDWAYYGAYCNATTNAITFSGNSVHDCPTGIIAQTAPLTLTGNTFANCGNGLFASGREWGAGTLSLSMSGNAFSGAGVGCTFAHIPASESFNLGNSTFADTLDMYVKLRGFTPTSYNSGPAMANVTATGTNLSTLGTNAEIEAKVFHDVDDATVGHVNWGQNSGAPATVCVLTVSPVTGSVGQTVQLTAKLTAGGVALAGQPVSFSVPGLPAFSNVLATTDPAGVAAVPYGPLVASGTITAKFSGVSPYKATIGTAALTVNAAAATSIVLTLSDDALVSGAAGNNTTTCTVVGNNGVDYTNDCTYYVQYGAGGLWSTVAPKNIYTCAKSGTWTVTAVYNTLTATKPLTVTAGAATVVTLTPATATINDSATQTYVVTATDAAGNTWTPAATCLTADGAGSFTDYTYTATGDAGTVVTITATVAPAAPVTATLNVNAAAGAGNILAWDKDTQKFYLCANASNPASGTEVTGSTAGFTISGGGTNVTVTSADGSKLQVQWYLRSGNVFRAYEYSTISAVSKTATYDGTRTLVDGTWKTGFWGLTHTIAGGVATYGSAQQ